MIYTILAAPSLAYLLILAYGWHLRFPFLNRRPFNCVVCLSAWTGILLFLMPEFISQGVAAFAISGIIGKIMYNNIN